MLSDLPADHSVTLDDLQSSDVVSVLGEVEGEAWTRTVEAIWLDACLRHGFDYHLEEPAEQEDGFDSSTGLDVT
jgi:phage FluMu gp28-like protein